jgi:hypothetical protein
VDLALSLKILNSLHPRMFVPSLIEIGLLVLEKRIFKDGFPVVAPSFEFVLYQEPLAVSYL